jgi:catechol 2,3-dioxygenase-like lactoylglutathione lyase family enzyme
MLDHISIRVADFDRSKRFFSEALAPLGYALFMENASGAGFRKEVIHDFWIKKGEPTPSVHIAFASPGRAAVDAFYRAALAAGARDNGPPGLRPNYHPNYYGAFVLDPDGYNIEAVCHKPE